MGKWVNGSPGHLMRIHWGCPGCPSSPDPRLESKNMQKQSYHDANDANCLFCFRWFQGSIMSISCMFCTFAGKCKSRQTRQAPVSRSSLRGCYSCEDSWNSARSLSFWPVRCYACSACYVQLFWLSFPLQLRLPPGSIVCPDLEA